MYVYSLLRIGVCACVKGGGKSLALRNAVAHKSDRHTLLLGGWMGQKPYNLRFERSFSTDSKKLEITSKQILQRQS